MLKTMESSMARPAVILVGADKGGVGKTTVTRTLLDYLGSKQIPRRAFDTESPKGNLKRFHPSITDIVDVTSASDQMKIFDTINTAEATVIDVRAGLLSATLKALRDIGFLEAARKGEFTLAVFHILGPSIASLEEIADTASYLTGANHYLVKNFINNTTFFDWDPSTSAYFKKIKGARESDRAAPQRTRLRAGRTGGGSLRVLRRQQDRRRRSGRLLVRAARLRPPLAEQRVGRVRPGWRRRTGEPEAAAPDRRLERCVAGDGSRRGFEMILIAFARSLPAARRRRPVARAAADRT